MGARELFFRVLKWRGRTYVHGVPVWAPLANRRDKDRILACLTESLDLLQTCAPQRYARVRRLLKGFLIFGTDDVRGSYLVEERVCRLGDSFVLDSATVASAIAATVVHEATHAWLSDLGVGYEEAIRHRVEHVCIRAALQVARKLPGAQDEVDRCRAQLTLTASDFSNLSFVQRDLRRLRELGCPEWIVRAIRWSWRKRFGAA